MFKDPAKINTMGQLAAVVIILCFSTLASLFILHPYLSARKKLTDTKAAVTILADSRKEIEQLNQELGRTGEVSERINMLLPARVNLDDVLGELNTISKLTDVRLELLSPGDMNTYERFRKLRLDLRLAGNFLDIYSFIYQLESIPQLNRVENLTISQRATDSECTVSLVMALYFAPLEKG